jgi:hypothetical protein
MLIIKNSLSFYVKIEILLHFLLVCRLWSVSDDVNMRNEAWSKMDRMYTKKSSERYFLDTITDRRNEDCSLEPRC